jgi:colanic acid biosynthesis glycosyl transferase WcaI
MPDITRHRSQFRIGCTLPRVSLTLLINAKDGEIARLVQRYECGVIVEPGQAQRLADLLRSLSENPRQLIAMGRRARQMLDAHFTRRHAFERWSGLLEQIG